MRHGRAPTSTLHRTRGLSYPFDDIIMPRSDISDGILDLHYSLHRDVTSFKHAYAIHTYADARRLVKLVGDTDSGNVAAHSWVKMVRVAALKLVPDPGVGIIGLDGEVMMQCSAIRGDVCSGRRSAPLRSRCFREPPSWSRHTTCSCPPATRPCCRRTASTFPPQGAR